MPAPVMLITGASRGIGAATARAAASSGYRLALVARSARSLSALTAELATAGTMTLPCDITEWSEIHAVVQRVEDEFGQLDAVFANAGVSVETSFLGTGGTEPDRWREMVLANVYGTALTARAALPALTRTHGHLLLTGSAAGRGIRPGNLYSATKWAVTAMGQNIRAECVGTGVRVTLIQPGRVETDMNRQGGDLAKLRPEDIAEAVLYALRQPASVDVNEVLIRPTGQDPTR